MSQCCVSIFYYGYLLSTFMDKAKLILGNIGSHMSTEMHDPIQDNRYKLVTPPLSITAFGCHIVKKCPMTDKKFLTCRNGQNEQLCLKNKRQNCSAVSH